MYVVKVMHGYIDKTGCRTREKLRQSAHFQRQKESEAFAKESAVVSNRYKRYDQIDSIFFRGSNRHAYQAFCRLCFYAHTICKRFML